MERGREKYIGERGERKKGSGEGRLGRRNVYSGNGGRKKGCERVQIGWVGRSGTREREKPIGKWVEGGGIRGGGLREDERLNRDPPSSPSLLFEGS